MVKFYAMQIRMHKIKTDDVPERYKAAVKALLDADA